MADERSRPPYHQPSPIPAAYAWPSLVARDVDALFDHYRHTLEELGPQALQVLDALLPRLVVGATAPIAAVAPADLAWLPEKDRPVLAAAIRLRCDVLVTEDRTHFGSGDAGRSAGSRSTHPVRWPSRCWPPADAGRVRDLRGPLALRYDGALNVMQRDPAPGSGSPSTASTPARWPHM